MATEKSPGELIQEAIVGLLEDGAASLTIGGRVPTILDEMPGERFSQKGMPLVLVDTPVKDSDEDFGGNEGSEMWQVPILLIDAVGVRKDTRLAGERRLMLLAEKVKHFLLGHDDRNWGLARLAVFASMTEWAIGSPTEEVGNNLLILPIKVAVGCTVPVGTIFTS